jgi:hypothetical protein
MPGVSAEPDADGMPEAGRLVHALASPELEVVRGALEELAQHAHAFRVDRSRRATRNDVRGIVAGFLGSRPEHELFPTAVWVLGMLHDPEAERFLVAIARRLVDDPEPGEALHQVYIALDNLGLIPAPRLDASLDRIEHARQWLRIFLASERVLAGPIDEHAFTIQASRPRVGAPDPDDETLGEVIESIFPMDAEQAYLVWDRIHIPLSYRYDIGTVIDEILEVVERVATDPTGTLSVAWPSDSFRTDWTLSWTAERIDIAANWHSVGGFVIDLLRARPRVAIARSAFLAEWARLLAVILDAMAAVGLDQHLGAEQLRRALAMVPGTGRLYAP